MVSVFVELSTATYEWYAQLAEEHCYTVSEYLEFVLTAKHAEASQGSHSGSFIYTKDND